VAEFERMIWSDLVLPAHCRLAEAVYTPVARRDGRFGVICSWTRRGPRNWAPPHFPFLQEWRGPVRGGDANSGTSGMGFFHPAGTVADPPSLQELLGQFFVTRSTILITSRSRDPSAPGQKVVQDISAITTLAKLGNGERQSLHDFCQGP